MSNVPELSIRITREREVVSGQLYFILFHRVLSKLSITALSKVDIITPSAIITNT